MKKSTFFLFLIAIFAYLGFSSCKHKSDCGENAPIKWGNKNVFIFETIKLSVSDTYYNEAGEEVLSYSKPITDFH